MDDATVKNLGFINVNIKPDKFNDIGALASTARGSIIELCYVTGKIENTTLGLAGGLIAFSRETEYKNCLNKADIIGRRVGGITGQSDDGKGYTNCINLGKITALNSNAGGGISAHIDFPTDIVSCFNAGVVEGHPIVTGDLVGSGGGSNASFIDCGYIAERSIGTSFTKTELATKMTKSQLKKQETYNGWDFEKTWYINAKINSGYPILQSMLRNYNQSKPVADKEPGKYAKGTKISLSTELKSVTIYYTTDGKTPTTSSKKYTGKITINADTTIKTAVFTDGGKIRGKVATYAYTVKK